PDGVLAGRPAAEIGSGDEYAGAVRLRLVQLEIGVWSAVGPVAPVVEQGGTEAGALEPLEELLRNDLVGVDVGPRQRRGLADVPDERLHQDASSSEPGRSASVQPRTSTSRPATAAAAAIAGLIRWVRPPRPCRPSKFRLEVEAQRSPGCRLSAFMPRHIEHPELRPPKPAARQ